MGVLRFLVLGIACTYVSCSGAVTFERDRWTGIETSASLQWSNLLRTSGEGVTTVRQHILLSSIIHGYERSRVVDLRQNEIALSPFPDKVVFDTSTTAWILSYRASQTVMAVHVDLIKLNFNRSILSNALAVSPCGDHLLWAHIYSDDVVALFVDDLCLFPVLQNGFARETSGSSPTDHRGLLPYQAAQPETGQTNLYSRLGWLSDTVIACVLRQALHPLDVPGEQQYRYIYYKVSWPAAASVGRAELAEVEATVVTEIEAKEKSEAILESRNYFNNAI